MCGSLIVLRKRSEIPYRSLNLLDYSKLMILAAAEGTPENRKTMIPN